MFLHANRSRSWTFKNGTAHTQKSILPSPRAQQKLKCEVGPCAGCISLAPQTPFTLFPSSSSVSVAWQLQISRPAPSGFKIGLTKGELHRRWRSGAGGEWGKGMFFWLPPCEVTLPGCVLWSLDSFWVLLLGSGNRPLSLPSSRDSISFIATSSSLQHYPLGFPWTYTFVHISHAPSICISSFP